jgi:UDP-N-acetylglucosamine 2-epimerase (non-hydrolysing)
VEAGCAKLVGTDTKRIVDAAAELLSDPASYQAMAKAKNPFGDGTSSKQILEILHKELRAASGAA